MDNVKERSSLPSVAGSRNVTGKTLENSTIDGAQSPKVKVLYIAGWGRSGSTILGRVLGQVEGFFLVGELRYVWDRGLIENRLCSCGLPFMECSLWQEVVTQTLGNNDHASAEALVDLRERELRTRHILLTPTLKGLQSRVAKMEKYPGAVERLYHAVRHVSGGSVIVDTSKFPSYGFVLQNLPSIELYVLHLVRDPRAVAYSWESRRKVKLDKDGSNKLMTPHGFAKSSLVWGEWNLAIENLRRHEPDRYMLLRYEDFVASPRSSVKRILGFLGEDQAELPFNSEREARLGVPHTFSGNPDRFRGGIVKIRPDETWKRKMGVTRQAAVTALTWPGLVRYGYSLWPQREGLPRPW
jgi:hypothetical protein